MNILSTGEFHHLGYACTSIEKEIPYFALLGYHPDGDIFEDPNQGIRGLFLKGNGPPIELLEPLNNSTTLTSWLKDGSRFYHMSYRVQDMEQAQDELQKEGARCISEPKKACAFEMNHVCFYMFRNGLIVELIEQ